MRLSRPRLRCAGKCVKIPGQNRRATSASKPTPWSSAIGSSGLDGRAGRGRPRARSASRASPIRIGASPKCVCIKGNYLLIRGQSARSVARRVCAQLDHRQRCGRRGCGGQFQRRGSTVRVTRDMNDVPAARTYAEFGPHQGNFDRWQLSEYYPPGYFFINNGSGRCGWMRADGTLASRPRASGVFRSSTASRRRPNQQPSILGARARALRGRSRRARRILPAMPSGRARGPRGLRGTAALARHRSGGASAEDVSASVTIEADRGLLMRGRYYGICLRKERQLEREHIMPNRRGFELRPAVARFSQELLPGPRRRSCPSRSRRSRSRRTSVTRCRGCRSASTPSSTWRASSASGSSAASRWR